MKADPQDVNASIECVQIAAAFIVEDDDAWAMFAKFMENVKGMPPEGRKVLDTAIYNVELVRHAICQHHGIDPGSMYPRKYE